MVNTSSNAEHRNYDSMNTSQQDGARSAIILTSCDKMYEIEF